jgi:agmatine deiminase
MTTPAADGLTMPPEFAQHEKTLMAWPCRRDLWVGELAQAKREYADVANAIAVFEPVTMVAATAQDAAEARAALTGDVDVVEIPIDDSWLRDSGPIFVVDDVDAPRRRAGVHFGFNAWGQKFPPWDRDAEIGGVLAARVGDDVRRAPLILEGGSIAVDGAGTLVTTEQCLLHPNRNPSLSREEIEGHLRDWLGAQRVVWLGDGLVEDRDTDGHVDLIAVFTAPGRLLLQSAPPGNPNHEAMAENRERAVAAGLEVIDFPPLAYATVGGEEVVASYLNLYVGNGFVVVPTAGQPDSDDEALRGIADAFAGREVVGVPAATIAFGGGGPHCITQQVPALDAQVDTGHQPLRGGRSLI